MSESTGRETLLEKHRWLVFVLPFAVFMLVGSLEPTTPDKLGGEFLGADIPYAYYPWVYTAKIALTVLAVVFVLGGYRPFPLRVSPLAVLVGVAGIVVWIGLCELGLEKMLLPMLKPLGLVDSGARSGYNPFAEIAGNPSLAWGPAWAWGFLAVRFFGLVVVVALIEEFFLRGFVMRFVMQRDWWDIPFGKVNATAVVVAAAYGMMTHPAELVAAAVWFLMVTWLMVKTRNIWDCVVAHAVTNLLLGIYVVTTGKWEYM